MISIIAALDSNNLIGSDNKLPWRLPADMRRFKSLTVGKPVVMGRKTFESIGRPLPDRTNIVLTSDKNFSAHGCTVAHSVDEALEAAGRGGEIMVIGGAHTYAQFMPIADRIYLTRIRETFEGDAYFPNFNPNDWKEIEHEEHEPDQENPYAYVFEVLERK